MPFEQRPNGGSLFKNKDRDSDKSPEYSGSINIYGREFWLSAWVKTSSKTGAKFFSLSAKPKNEAPRQEMNDTMPF